MDDNNQDQPVQDAQIVTESEEIVETEAPSEGAQTLVLESLESLIRENLAKIDKLKEEARNHKEMLDSALLNDEVYRQHDEAAKSAAKIKNSTKAEILKRPENSTLNNKLKEVKNEINEIQESMDSYLQEYRRLSGSDEIENDKGESMQIVYKAVLVRRP